MGQDHSVAYARKALAVQLPSVSAVPSVCTVPPDDESHQSPHMREQHGRSITSDGLCSTCRGSSAMNLERRVAALEALQLQSKMDPLRGIAQSNNNLQLE